MALNYYDQCDALQYSDIYFEGEPLEEVNSGGSPADKLALGWEETTDEWIDSNDSRDSISYF